MLAAEGLLALAWPKEYGGGGGSVWQQTVLREEMWAHHEPRGPQYMGVNWVGPAIMRYGTAEQKAKHLPAIAAGDVIWCQGFSEPEAGTDLASLRTRAVPRRRRVGASPARRCGRRTPRWRPGACSRHAPIPMPQSPSGSRLFLIPMDRAGFTVRPIPSMLGPASPQRDVPRRGAGIPRRRARRGRRRLAGDARGTGIRTRRHRALRPVRIAAATGCAPNSATTGTGCPNRFAPAGFAPSSTCGWPDCSPTAPYRCRTTRPRVRRPAPRASPPPPAISRSPSCSSTCWVRRRCDGGMSGAAARGDRRPLALRTGGHRGVGHHRGATNAGGTRRPGSEPR